MNYKNILSLFTGLVIGLFCLNVNGAYDPNAIPSSTDIMAGNGSGALVGTGINPASVVTNGQNELYLAQQGVTLERFGATPLKALADVATTNGSQIIYSASANFTSADVGKWLAVYTDSYNTNWTLSLITNVLSTTQVQLSNAATATVTGMKAKYGFDCVPAIQAAYGYMYSNNVFNCYASNCTYMLVGSLTNTGTNQISLITSPASPQFASTNAFFNRYSIIGVSPQNRSQSGYFSASAAPETGSIFYCPVKQTAAADCCVFGFSNTNRLQTACNFGFKNIAFIQPCSPQLTWINDSISGSIFIENCEFNVDYSAGKMGSFPGGNGSYAIKMPIDRGVGGVNGPSHVQDTEISGYDIGIQAGQHQDFNRVLISACGFGFSFCGGSVGSTVNMELINSMTNFTTVEADTVSATAGQIAGTIKTETSGGNTRANFLIAPSGWSPQVIGNLTLLEDYPDFTDGTNHFKNPPVSLNVNYNKYGLSSASNIYGATLTDNHFIKGMMASSTTSGGDTFSKPVIVGPTSQMVSSVFGLFFSSQFSQAFFRYDANGTYFQTLEGTTRAFLSGKGDLTINGLLTATNGISVKTNAGPTSVTIGVTAPDYWMLITNLNTGGPMWTPCWTNH